MNQKAFSTVIVTVTILILLLSGVIYFKFSEKNISPAKVTPDTSYSPSQDMESSQSAQIPTKEIEGWTEYENKYHNYSLSYPSNWYLKECSIGSEPMFTNINVYIDTQPINECNSFPGPRISIYPTYNQTIDEIVDEAIKSQGRIADFSKQEAEVNGKRYIQMTSKIKVTPLLPLPFTEGVGTFVELPEKQEVLSVGFAGSLNNDVESNVYRKIVSSIKLLEE